MRGLYIHIPFCATKCEYCDFYSIKYNSSTVKKYVEVLCQNLKTENYVFDTVYFGGGTPSLIGADNLTKILSNVKYKENSEITVECNPRTVTNMFFNKIKQAGFNRVSIGLQSANEDELKFLTRNHNLKDVEDAVLLAKNNGIVNISLDVMVGLQNQTIESLKETLDFCIKQDVSHISCYMLKIEKNTPFYNKKLILPNDDTVADMYLYMCQYLEKNGYKQYEISNFCKDNKYSRHNLIYWNCDEYLGLGPAAHSFINGKRYYYPNDINYFLEGKERIFDQNGGDLYEYVMLRLRLNEGIILSELSSRGFSLNNNFIGEFKKLQKAGLALMDEKSLKLTPKGFLVQNSVLTDLLEVL